MSHEMKRVLGTMAVAVGLLIAWGCSVDSPTTPTQQPQPPRGSTPVSETWNITLTAVPDEISPGGGSRVDVLVLDAAGNWPANGTLIDLVVNRGNFLDAAGALTNTLGLTLTRGQSAAEFLAINLNEDPLSGNFRVTASLASSSAIELITTSGGAVVADFEVFVAGLSVGFENNSTGNITSFFWDFGDGTTSSEFEPIHQYEAAGDYLVTLTVVGPGGSDSKIAVVNVSEP